MKFHDEPKRGESRIFLRRDPGHNPLKSWFQIVMWDWRTDNCKRYVLDSSMGWVPYDSDSSFCEHQRFEYDPT